MSAVVRSGLRRRRRKGNAIDAAAGTQKVDRVRIYIRRADAGGRIARKRHDVECASGQWASEQGSNQGDCQSKNRKPAGGRPSAEERGAPAGREKGFELCDFISVLLRRLRLVRSPSAMVDDNAKIKVNTAKQQVKHRSRIFYTFLCFGGPSLRLAAPLHRCESAISGRERERSVLSGPVTQSSGENREFVDFAQVNG